MQQKLWTEAIRTGGTRPFAISVSIINYRTKEMTIRCVRSVLADMTNIDGHVVVVDNCSSDGSAEAIEDWIAENGTELSVTLVRSATNSGFSGGHNQGITARAADFYLLLNSDAELRPGFISALLDAARAAPAESGLFAPRLEHEDGTPQISQFRFPGPLSEFVRGAATGPVTRFLKRWDVPLDISTDSSQIGWVSFACILLRHEMIEALGPMDEGYFLYFEDCEYCLRARRAGWSIFPVPEARAVHYRGGSSPVKRLAAARKRLPAYFYASRTRFLYQAHGRTGLLAANLLWHLGRAVALIRWFAGKPVPTTIDGEARDIWKNFANPLREPQETRG